MMSPKPSTGFRGRSQAVTPTRGQLTSQEVCTDVCESIQTGGNSDSSVEVEEDPAMMSVVFP
jgi:hypothetical protein